MKMNECGSSYIKNIYETRKMTPGAIDFILVDQVGRFSININMIWDYDKENTIFNII